MIEHHGHVPGRGDFPVMNHEAALLYRALCYEEGHPRRTQHILKVYALAKLLGEQERLPEEERQILQAGAILHDIAIRYCKEHGDGEAGPDRQRQAAPLLVSRFLEEAGYPPSCVPAVLELVACHHDYHRPRNRRLQLLMEADLIVNCYERRPEAEERARIEDIFETEGGRKLLALCLNEYGR